MTPTIPKLHGRKKGRVTPQEAAWVEELLPSYLPPTALDHHALRHALAMPPSSRLVLEVGFGNGQALAAQAAAFPQDRFIGIDVFLEGVSALLRRLRAAGIENVRVLRGDALALIPQWLPPTCLDRVIVNFPDPWPKLRHHKRRLVQPPFLDLAATSLRPGGLLTMATDWEEYAHWMLEQTQPHPAFENLASDQGFSAPPADWVVTRFQERGWRAGRQSFHLCYRRKERESLSHS